MSTGDTAQAENPALETSSKNSKAKPSSQTVEKAPKLTSSQLAQLKSLYLVKQAGPKEIADKLGITAKSAGQWIYRLGLAKKREALAKVVEAKELAKAQSDVERAMDSWKAQSEEVTEDLFDLTRQSIASDSKYKAKELAAYSQAVKNFTAVFRDSAGVSSAPAQNTQVNIWLGSLPRAGDAAVDVTATATKQQLP